jgi:hypothetical protein
MDIDAETRPCAHAGCDGAGTHRAPRSRTALDDYLWFCLDHVREYNAAWNYCAGMSTDDIERRVRRDTIWERPTWTFGAGRFAPGAAARFASAGPGPGPRVVDGFGVLGEDEAEAGARNGHHPGGQANGHANGNGYRGRHQTEVTRALAVLGLEPPVTRADLKSRYKALAKRLHPDANGGDRAAEDRLKDINLAYATLRKSDLIR